MKQPKPPALAVVIAHYHPSGRVPRNLYALVRWLRTVTPRIVFVSTNIDKNEIEGLEPLARVIVRENFGYDFWSYKVGIDALGDLSGVDRLAILNSSFITLHPRLLCPNFTAPVDVPRVRGLSECRLPVPHLQSYCMFFEHRSLLASPAFRDWWAGMTPISDRDDVVARQEVGMSSHFAAAGIPLEAVFRPTQNDLAKAVCRLIGGSGPAVRIPLVSEDSDRLVVKLERGLKLNPTHFMWDALLMSVGILKIELIRDNPMNMGLKTLQDRLAARPGLKALVDDALVGETPRARTHSRMPGLDTLDTPRA